MQLPADEEDDEEVMRVPKALKVALLPLLHSKPHHHRQAERHDPSRDSWSRGEVELEEGDEARPDLGRSLVGEPRGVNEVRDDAVRPQARQPARPTFLED